jgi:hypothetical protein
MRSLVRKSREHPHKAVKGTILQHSCIVTWYHLENSSPSGFLKYPPTSAPQNEIPATDSDRHMGIVICR